VLALYTETGRTLQGNKAFFALTENPALDMPQPKAQGPGFQGATQENRDEILTVTPFPT
jgi:hypothetical protein